jgi:hypothetical protein
MRKHYSKCGQSVEAWGSNHVPKDGQNSQILIKTENQWCHIVANTQCITMISNLAVITYVSWTSVNMLLTTSLMLQRQVIKYS